MFSNYAPLFTCLIFKTQFLLFHSGRAGPAQFQHSTRCCRGASVRCVGPRGALCVVARFGNVRHTRSPFARTREETHYCASCWVVDACLLVSPCQPKTQLLHCQLAPQWLTQKSFLSSVQKKFHFQRLHFHMVHQHFRFGPYRSLQSQRPNWSTFCNEEL